MISDVTSIYVGIAAFLAMRHGGLLVNRVTLFLGRISYSLCLFHPLCLGIVTAWARAHGGPGSAAIMVVLVVSGSIVLATLVERLVETPSDRFGKTVRTALARPGRRAGVDSCSAAIYHAARMICGTLLHNGHGGLCGAPGRFDGSCVGGDSCLHGNGVQPRPA